jgi:hypothetical protein
MRYYRSTKDLGLTLCATGDYVKSPLLDYHGYCDSDWAGDVSTHRSTTGYIYFIANAPISWKTAWQHAVTLSSTEAEYYTFTEAAKEAKWHQSLLEELKYTDKDVCPAVLYRDNTGSLDLSENPLHHRRSKHIQICIHYIQEQVAEGCIDLGYVPSAEMTADRLTKPLGGLKHEAFLAQLGLESWKRLNSQ